MIKMTSPNLNVLAAMGAVPGLVVVIITGLDSSRVTLDHMSTILQTSAWLLSFSFTLLYGCLFSKTWRVFLIFRNLNSNGKVTFFSDFVFPPFFVALFSYRRREGGP